MGPVWLEMTRYSCRTWQGWEKMTVRPFWQVFRGFRASFFYLCQVISYNHYHTNSTSIKPQHYVQVTEWTGCSSHDRFCHLPFHQCIVAATILYSNEIIYLSACFPTRQDDASAVSIFSTKMSSSIICCEECVFAVIILYVNSDYKGGGRKKLRLFSVWLLGFVNNSLHSQSHRTWIGHNQLISESY